jgi:hypothetical protein
VINLFEEVLESDEMDEGLVACIFALLAQLERKRLYAGGPWECAGLLGDDGGAWFVRRERVRLGGSLTMMRGMSTR